MGEPKTESARVLEFVRAAKAKGADDATIMMMLRESGWSERKIQSALVDYAQETFGLEPPARGGRGESARDAFFYLLNFALLGTWTAALVWLADILIDFRFRDPLVYGYAGYERSDAAGQLASLLIAFPVFLWVNVLLNREIAARPETLDSGVRKWLTYIALVLTAGCVVGDITTFLAAFLSGGLTVSFVYKALFLLIVSAGTFTYYLRTIRVQSAPTALNRGFGAAAIVVVIVGVIAGFMGIGSPAYERSLYADNRRVSDLKAIADSIFALTPSHAPPATLAALRLPLSDLIDPLTNARYGYKKTGAMAYKLCATFEAKSDETDTDPRWAHPEGAWCYHVAAQTGAPAR